ncbi:MAG: glycosyltransferase family 2 protein [Myxococcota bacterium]
MQRNGHGERPLFSIITACLNAEATIGRTLESVRAQDCRDFEMIVVDGGSTDGTLRLVEGYRDVVTQVQSGKDKGISDAFNKGLLLATGQYVAMINADDWYEPNALSTVARAIHDDPADVYCGRLRYWDGEHEGATFDAEPRHLARFMSINHMATFARRMLFVEHGGFRHDLKAAMDYELFLRFFMRGATFRRVDAVLANMRLGGYSDRRWRLALKEVRISQRDNGVGAIQAWGHWGFQLAKGGARRALERVGGDTLVRLYRERVALVPKSAPGGGPHRPT